MTSVSLIIKLDTDELLTFITSNTPNNAQLIDSKLNQASNISYGTEHCSFNNSIWMYSMQYVSKGHRLLTDRYST